MDLLLIRHGKAEDRDAFARTGRPDDLRPLTGRGRREMRENARGLRALVGPLDVLATSPLVRAAQTADEVAAAFPEATRETIDSLRPSARFADFVDWLVAHRDRARLAAVGHNPHLSELAAHLCRRHEQFDMKKGSAVLLHFADEPAPGSATLVWYRKPKELRAAAD